MTRHREEKEDKTSPMGTRETKKPFGFKKTAPAGYSSYEVVASEGGAVVKSKKRNPPKAEGYSKRLLIALDTDLIDKLEMQPATLSEAVNALVRDSIDRHLKNKTMLVVVVNPLEEK